MKPRVFVTKKIPKEVENYIAQYCDYEIWQGKNPIPRFELLGRLAGCHGLLTTGIKIDAELLHAAPHLRTVSNISVGYNNFDIEAMRANGVIGTHTPYVLDDTVADLAFGLILACARRIPELDAYVKNGDWSGKEEEHMLFGTDVHHKTLGIIGLGRIGTALAKRAGMGFDMKVLYSNRRRRPEIENQLGIIYRSRDQLLEESDFIVVLTPLNRQTYHLIGESEFQKMKPNSIFINISRGDVVDENAMVKALQNHQIRGVGLDVFSVEPPNTDNPLLKMKNVVTVPHIGSATEQTRFAMAMTAAQNLVHALNGQPTHVVPELQTQ